MSFPAMPAPPRLHTFALQSCHDMVAKLGRELERMRASAHDPDALTDHAANFALTAWHLVDWTWAEIKGNAELRARVAAMVGCEPRDLDRDRFAAWCREQCPDLIACQVIATATKHVGCDRDEAATIRARVSLQDVRGGIATGPLLMGPLLDGAPPRWVAKIMRDDRTEPAEPVFERVRTFWATLLPGPKNDRQTTP